LNLNLTISFGQAAVANGRLAAEELWVDFHYQPRGLWNEPWITNSTKKVRPSLWRTIEGFVASDEYHNALERQRKYQESLKRKWMTPKNAVVGGVILIFNITILQLLPYLVKMVGIQDTVLLGKWLIGLVGVITVATFIYIFTSEG